MQTEKRERREREVEGGREREQTEREGERRVYVVERDSCDFLS